MNLDDLAAYTDRIRRRASRGCPWHGDYCPGRVPLDVLDELLDAMHRAQEEAA